MRDPFLTNIKEQIRSQFNLTEPVHYELRKLKEAEEFIRSKYEEGVLTSPIDLERLKRKVWIIVTGSERKLEELSSEESKYLAQIAYMGDERKLIEYSEFWNFSRKQLENVKRTSMLSRWLHAYLRYHNDGITHSDDLGDTLQKSISRYEGPSRRVETWKEKNKLFFDNAENKSIGKGLLESSQTIEQLLKTLRLSTEIRGSQFANRIIKEMIDTVADKFPRFYRLALDQLKIKKADGLYEKRSKDLARYAASKLMISAGINCKKKHKKHIRNVFIDQLGDPRSNFNRSNWEDVDEESMKVFMQWLSQRDIEFFFEVVSETENQIAKKTHWRYRKKFWEAYLPYIENTWVVMGYKAEKMAKILFSEQEIGKLKYGKLKGANSKQSVFFLRMQGYDIVEYSHQGASRIWKVDKSPLAFRKKSVHVNKFRRDDTTNIKRFIHASSEHYRWQRKLSSWIRYNIGIEPSKTYRLHN